MSAVTIDTLLSVVALVASSAAFALAVYQWWRARRRQRERDEAARVEVWAAANPHLVALAEDVGPVAAGLLAASYPDALLRRWHRETDGGRRS